MNDGLRAFLAAIRKAEGRNYGETGPSEEGVKPFGAYGMLTENWDAWSAGAGLAGHDKFDPEAQDYVASYWAQKLFKRYGDWDMVAMAWFAGAEQTDKAVASGEGEGWFKHKSTRNFFAKYKSAEERDAATAENQREPLPSMARAQEWTNPNGAPRGWLMPLAGQNEYSNSFRVPRNNKAGIHGAIDVYAKKGVPIVAPVGGKVLSTKYGEKGGYTVRVRGTDGLTYYFAHMDSQSVVNAGDTIQAGAHLGFVGASGNAKGTSPHLHFSIRKGNQLVNPYSYLQGSRNAGNYYSPESVPKGDEQSQTGSEKYNGLLGAISNRVAGGSRVDYRTLGQDPEDVASVTTDRAGGASRKVSERDKGPY